LSISTEDLPVVDGGDESISDGLDSLVEVRLTGKDIDGHLRQEQGVSRDGCGGDRTLGKINFSYYILLHLILLILGVRKE